MYRIAFVRLLVHDKIVLSCASGSGGASCVVLTVELREREPTNAPG